MDELKVVATTALELDPVLPPVMLTDERVETSMRLGATRAVLPLVVRPAESHIERLLVVVDPWRFAALRKAGAESVQVLVRPLTDTEALQLAYAEEERGQVRRTYIERAWLVAALVERGGATQCELARETGDSTGMFSHLKTVGRTITPERLESAGISSAELNELAFGELVRIASLGEEDIAPALHAAVSSAHSDDRRTAAFEFSPFRRGTGWKAAARGEVDGWSHEELAHAAASLGPVVDKVRAMIGQPSPDASKLRSDYEAKLLELRAATATEAREMARRLSEAASAQLRLSELNLELLREVSRARQTTYRRPRTISSVVSGALTSIRRRFGRPADSNPSIAENAASEIEATLSYASPNGGMKASARKEEPSRRQGMDSFSRSGRSYVRSSPL